MDIWIIQDGEKTGPLHDFEVRRKIEIGELPPTTPAWHEGLDTWKPLQHIELFAKEFDKPISTPDSPDRQDTPATPPPSSQPHLVRRFWARWFDLYLYAGIWWIAIWAAGRDIRMILEHQWIILLHYVPWFVLETFLIHRFATTPGKWLLGLRVTNRDGSLLTLAEATRRSFRVLFLGLGFGWGWLALICQAMAYITTKRIGSPLWDQTGDHRLDATPVDPFRLVIYIFGLAAGITLHWLVLGPYVIEQVIKNSPDQAEQIQRSAPWHLPPRH